MNKYIWKIKKAKIFPVKSISNSFIFSFFRFTELKADFPALVRKGGHLNINNLTGES